MSTIFVTVVLIILMFWCGTGPVLLLIPRQNSARRVLLLPFVGLCGHMLFSLVLARFNLTGHTISIIALVFFSVLACWGLYRAPLSRHELRQSLAPLLLAAGSMAFIALPLFQAGFERYWGYANPDQIYLSQVLDWVYTHPFGVPPNYRSSEEAYRAVGENTLLAVFYVLTTVAAITRTAPDLLFNVSEAGMVFLTPLGLYVFATTLGLSRRRSLLASACVGCSSLVAYTFCLDSLAALSVIAVVPIAVALLLRFGEEGSMAYGLLFVLVSAAMYYNYLGAIGVLGVLISATLLRLLVYRRISVYRLLVPPLLTLVVIAVAFTPYAYSIFLFFLNESISSRLSHFTPSPANAEILSFFSLSLTERGVPFFWGLYVPGVPAWKLWGGSPTALSPYLFGAGCLCFALLALSLWPRISRLSGSYTWILIAALLPILAYAYRGMGYGVFKLVAWVHPIVITGFIAALCGLADLLRRGPLPRLALVPYLAVAAYMGINGELVYRLGRYTRTEATSGSPQNASNLTFENVRELRTFAIPRYWRQIAIMIPDVVAQNWTAGYLGPVIPRPFPDLSLVTQDSLPRTVRPEPPETYFLRWNGSPRDIAEYPRAPAVWNNSSLALSRFDQLNNDLVIGHGWYRVEGADAAPTFWQKRFRWVRKRAEVLVWNPSPRPQRLLLTLTAGYGNPKPGRHISMFLNGEKFDEIEFSGYARLLTKPFKALPPWSQIELEIKEDANPLPRLGALWAFDVPREPRRLNIAVSELRLVEVDDSAMVVPSYLDLQPEFQKPKTFLDGIYPDGWMGAAATLSLHLSQEARHVEIVGALPNVPGLRVPFRVNVEMDGRDIGDAAISQFGPFRAVIPLSRDDKALHPGQTVRLKVKAESTFLGQNADPRPLSIHLKGVGFTK